MDKKNIDKIEYIYKKMNKYNIMHIKDMYTVQEHNNKIDKLIVKLHNVQTKSLSDITQRSSDITQQE